MKPCGLNRTIAARCDHVVAARSPRPMTASMFPAEGVAENSIANRPVCGAIERFHHVFAIALHVVASESISLVSGSSSTGGVSATHPCHAAAAITHARNFDFD